MTFSVVNLSALPAANPPGPGDLFLLDQVNGPSATGWQSRKLPAQRAVSYNDAMIGFGATGDGTTDDTAALQAALNGSFTTITSGNIGTAAPGQRNLFIPAGNYMITRPLTFSGMVGVTITGAGKLATTIFNPNGTGIFDLNSCSYNNFHNMILTGVNGGTEVLFDLNWDGTTGFTLQNNTFNNVWFNQGGTGCRIAYDGYMGSENGFYHCRWSNINGPGLLTASFNAVNNWVFGGECESCNVGLHALYGSIPIIHGVAFEGQTGYDIEIDNAALDAYSINGCRSESQNFVNAGQGSGVIDGCTHYGTVAGQFLYAGNGGWKVHGCTSNLGAIQAGPYLPIVEASAFGVAAASLVTGAYPIIVNQVLTGGTYVTGTPVMNSQGLIGPVGIGYTPGGVPQSGVGGAFTFQLWFTFGTAPPTGGLWAVGAICFNSVPSAGNPIAWQCTVAGVPGTWVSIGNLP